MGTHIRRHRKNRSKSNNTQDKTARAARRDSAKLLAKVLTNVSAKIESEETIYSISDNEREESIDRLWNDKVVSNSRTINSLDLPVPKEKRSGLFSGMEQENIAKNRNN